LKERLIEVIKEVGIEGARYIEENIDLQYYYIKKLYEKIGDEENLVRLVILNSLSSYQLSSRAEEWWREFSEYFSNNKPKDVLNDYIEFLKKSRTNRRFINRKIDRMIKVRNFIKNLSLDRIYEYYNDMLKLKADLDKSLGVKKYYKTVVFSVKMFGYSCRIIFNKFIAYPFEIDIPLDNRMIKFTRRFTNKNFLEFWREVSIKSNVPPLHIDSIFWPFLGNRYLIGTYEENLGVLSKDLWKILSFLCEEVFRGF